MSIRWQLDRAGLWPISTAGDRVAALEAGTLASVTAGNIAASKALVVDSSKKLNGVLAGGGLISSLVSAVTKTNSVNTEQDAVTAEIPVASLAAGAAYRLSYIAKQTAHNSATSRIRLYVAGTAIYDTTALACVTNNFIAADVDIVIRTINASTGTIATFKRGNSLLVSTAAHIGGTNELTSKDTTAVIPVKITVTYSATGSDVTWNFPVFNLSKI